MSPPPTYTPTMKPNLFESMRARLHARAGLTPAPYAGTPAEQKATLKELERTEWCPEFERLMRNRLLMGALRYGRLRAPGKPNYNRMPSIMRRLEKYEATGNLEHLVDIANLCLVEYVEGRHPKRHFHAVDNTKEHADTKPRADAYTIRGVTTARSFQDLTGQPVPMVPIPGLVHDLSGKPCILNLGTNDLMSGSSAKSHKAAVTKLLKAIKAVKPRTIPDPNGDRLRSLPTQSSYNWRDAESAKIVFRDRPRLRWIWIKGHRYNRKDYSSEAIKAASLTI